MKNQKKNTLFNFIVVIVLCIAFSLQSVSPAFAVGIGVKTKKTDYITAKDWPKAPEIGAEGAVLIDAKTGQVLYAKNADTAFYPASITKIMTALLALENCKLDDKVTFEGDALSALPLGYAAIAATEGETMSAEDWITALLVHSAGDAANALASHVGGTLSNFADMMNERAKKAGAKNTHFNNPSGLQEDNHYTTPYDMAMIMKDCIKNDDFVRISSLLSYTIEPNNKRTQPFTFATRHQMLPIYSSNYYPYAICGKTGYTSQAGYTLVTYAKKDDMELICCVMKCDQDPAKYNDTKALFEYGFKNFYLCDASKEDTRYTFSQSGIFSNLNDDFSELSISLKGDSQLILPRGLELSDLDTKLSYNEKSGSGNFAKVTYSYEGMKLGSAQLSLKKVDVKDISMKIFDNNTIYINIWYVVIVGILLVGILVVVIIKKRKNRNRLRF